VPAAIAWPGQATSTGVGKERMRSERRAPRVSISTISPGRSWKTLRSNPAEKNFSRPVRTTTASSFSAWSSADITAFSISIEKALTLPSSIAIVATFPSSS
jgi:hypothetical protein